MTARVTDNGTHLNTTFVDLTKAFDTVNRDALWFMQKFGYPERFTHMVPSQVLWYAQGRLRPRQPPAPSPIPGLLDSVLTPGSGGGGGESAVAAAQGYNHLKLINAQVTVPAPSGVEHTVDLVEIDGPTVISLASPFRQLSTFVRALIN
ncbi:unnamed protein product [Schistocephalus solidus]|uniref:Reverse transcriptase domain-containing protein n=1 Tax=Schistocephalus solidus TaxID=70667 RepID=A0A183T893_SCHSO|nr:unnamed protein product [Schistocephalus solidus]